MWLEITHGQSLGLLYRFFGGCNDNIPDDVPVLHSASAVDIATGTGTNVEKSTSPP